jgi:DNA-binding CsgD family transcriptional regulator
VSPESAIRFEEAGADPDRWHVALRAVSTLFGGLACGVRVERPDGTVSQIWHGLPDDLERDYLAHYHALDPWMPKARALPVGRCVPSQDLVPDHVLDASEFFQDFLRPRGLRELVGGIVERSPDQGLTTFAVMRANGERVFGRADAAQLESFLPRIGQALWIDRQLSALDTPGSDLRVASFVLDTRGVIRGQSRAAAALLEAGSSLVAPGGRLQAVCPISDAALWAQIHAATSGPGTGRCSPRYVAVRRTRGPALLATVALLGEHVSTLRVAGPRPGVLVVVHDPLQPVDLRLVESKLCQLYGLTPAEARVGALVGSGHSPNAAAAQLGITPGTARYQLKQAYSRAGLSGQRELVRLVSMLSQV